MSASMNEQETSDANMAEISPVTAAGILMQFASAMTNGPALDAILTDELGNETAPSSRNSTTEAVAQLLRSMVPIEGKTETGELVHVLADVSQVVRVISTHHRLLSNPAVLQSVASCRAENFTDPALFMQFYHLINSLLHPPPVVCANQDSSFPSSSVNLISEPAVSSARAAGNPLVVRKTTPKIGPCSCPHCGKVFHARRNLYFHERQVHDVQSTICPECQRPLKNQATLIRHRRTHYGPLDLLYVCQDCGKRCKERRHLAIHCANLGHQIPAFDEDTSTSDSATNPSHDSTECELNDLDLDEVGPEELDDDV